MVYGLHCRAHEIINSSKVLPVCCSVFCDIQHLGAPAHCHQPEGRARPHSHGCWLQHLQHCRVRRSQPVSIPKGGIARLPAVQPLILAKRQHVPKT